MNKQDKDQLIVLLKQYVNELFTVHSTDKACIQCINEEIEQQDSTNVNCQFVACVVPRSVLSVTNMLITIKGNQGVINYETNAKK